MCKTPNNTLSSVGGLEMIAFFILLKHVCILHGRQKFFKYYPHIPHKNERMKKERERKKKNALAVGFQVSRREILIKGVLLVPFKLPPANVHRSH